MQKFCLFFKKRLYSQINCNIMEKRYFLAFDMGATSGRAVLAAIDDNGLLTEEINRFNNSIKVVNGNCYWNIWGIMAFIKSSLAICSARDIKLSSIGIDTWGVDFVYVDEDGKLLDLPRAYRDKYTTGMPEKFFRKISKREVYNYTGIQTMAINSLFQLYASVEDKNSPIHKAKHILFMPDALSYLLTGKMVTEYTIASTSQLLNATTHKFEPKLLQLLGLDVSVFAEIVMPGTLIGCLTDDIAAETGAGNVPVYAVAGHDTASAVAAVPAVTPNFAFLSSGTWSLMGIEVEKPILTDAAYAADFTNEGGVDGTITFLKNITGLWILEQCRKVWQQTGKDYSYAELTAMAAAQQKSNFVINVDDEVFANPDNMLLAMKTYCDNHNFIFPENDAAVVRLIFDSLVAKYKEVFSLIGSFASEKIEVLHIIGGGSKNTFLNGLIADALGVKVVAGPAEATAMGNIMIQMRAAGMA